MPDISPQEVLSKLQTEFDSLPDKPGVYILKNPKGIPVYVGKASSIKNRVLAHLRPRLDDPMGQALKDHIAIADYIFTHSSLEALILENVLIKRHKPRYNIRLKDDKSYPFVKISNDPVPRVLVTRKIEDDGSDYFGPYGNVRAARRTVKYLRRIFPIRGCSLPLDWKKKFRSCIDYNIGICRAPCIFAVSRQEYEQDVRKFKLFLDGKLVQLSKVMYQEMWEASERQEYEQASKLRNEIRSLEATALKQRIAFPNQTRDKDVVTIARDGALTAAIVFQVREGNVVGREKFLIEGTHSSSKDNDILEAFLMQHYSVGNAGSLPQEIVIPNEPNDLNQVQELIRNTSKRTNFSLILFSSNEDNIRLMKLAQENAAMVLKEEENKGEVRKRERVRALKDLKEVLDLGKLPRRIECFDISNIRGNEAVGAMTVFFDGFPQKSEYRKFKIKTVKGIDDYSMMAEMVSRRLHRLMDTGDKKWSSSQPDLIVIDGGRGHLNAVLEQMRKDGIFGIPTISLAKREELVFRSDRMLPLKLSRDSEALHVLQNVRDEAHRFGITYHRKLRAKKITRSILDEIPGIGEKKKRNLIAHFGSVDAVKRASIEELTQIPLINEKQAAIIWKALN